MVSKIYTKKTKDNQSTFVYIIEAGTYFKIGITKSLANRVKQIQTGCPIKISSVRYITTNSKYQSLTIEKGLHSFFNKVSTSGEWFLSSNNWLNDAENFVKKEKNNIGEFFQIYFSTNYNNDYEEIINKVCSNKNICDMDKLQILNKIKNELVIEYESHLSIYVDKKIERILNILSLKNIETHKHDYRIVTDRNNDEGTKRKELEINTNYKNKIIDKKNFKDNISYYSELIKKCYVGDDIKILEKIMQDCPLLKKECDNKISFINKKIDKVKKSLSYTNFISEVF